MDNNTCYTLAIPSEQSNGLFRYSINRNSSVGDIAAFSFEFLFFVISLTVLGFSVHLIVMGLYNYLFGTKSIKPRYDDYERPYDI